MKESWKTAAVGLMVLMGLTAIWAVYRYVDERASMSDGYRVFARFGDVQGLIPKSRVLVAGIPVGFIDGIRLEGAQARVDIQIEADVALYEDASVTMKSVSLLGERVLVIDPGSMRHPQLEDGAELRVIAGAVSTDDVLMTVDQIAKSVSKVTDQLERAFGNDLAGDRMSSALENLSEALEGINRTIQTNEGAVQTTLENVAQATQHIRDLLDQHHEELSHGLGEVDDTVASIHRASEQLEKVMQDVRSVTERTARGEGTIGRLTQDEALIDEVEGVAEGLGDIVGGFSRLRTIVELRTEYYQLAGGFKTYVSLRLQPRESRYFLLQVIDDPRGKETRSITTVRRSPAIPGEPGEFVEERIRRTDAFRFSLMLAKRVSVATFRFGILESTGGLGVDLNFFKDRLEITNDAFALGVERFPRWRARLSAEILKRFWLLGGIDDILNDGSRDYFFGLMLRFDDEDLKSLIPFAGGLTPG